MVNLKALQLGAKGHGMVYQLQALKGVKSDFLSPGLETVSTHWGADFEEAAMEKVGKEKLATAQ